MGKTKKRTSTSKRKAKKHVKKRQTRRNKNLSNKGGVPRGWSIDWGFGPCEGWHEYCCSPDSNRVFSGQDVAGYWADPFLADGLDWYACEPDNRRYEIRRTQYSNSNSNTNFNSNSNSNSNIEENPGAEMAPADYWALPENRRKLENLYGNVDIGPNNKRRRTGEGVYHSKKKNKNNKKRTRRRKRSKK